MSASTGGADLADCDSKPTLPPWQLLGQWLLTCLHRAPCRQEAAPGGSPAGRTGGWQGDNLHCSAPGLALLGREHARAGLHASHYQPPCRAVYPTDFSASQPPRPQALLAAAAAGDAAAIAALLAGGRLNPDAPRSQGQGWTALHLAAASNHLAAVNVLLAHGASPAVSAPAGLQPLHLAAQNGCVFPIFALLAAGANPNAAASGGISPLKLAARYSHLPAIQALLAAGASLPSGAEGPPSILRALGAAGFDSREALCSAAAAGNVGSLQLLLDLGVQVAGSGALYSAARAGSLAAVDALLVAEVPVVDMEENELDFAMFEAAVRSHTTVMQRLIAAGADVEWLPVDLHGEVGRLLEHVHGGGGAGAH